MPEAGGGARLSDLEARWRVDRSPRVFLQLADELRRTGALARAVEVLREGLSHHPESLSGRVALGRAELEAGDAAAAARTFERVLARDPAQIVASKLLIEAWIRIGDAAQARERLDIYRILQERDVEIGGFERRIAAMERSERLSTVIELAGIAPPAAEAEPPAAAPLFDLGGSSELPLLPPLTVPALRAVPAGRGVSPSASEALGMGGGEMPFGTIHDPAASGARILSFFRTQALFLAPVTALAAAPAESLAEREAPPLLAAEIPREPDRVAEPAVSAAVVPEPISTTPPEPAAVEARVGSAPITETPGASAVDESAERELAGGLAPGMTFEQFSTTGFAAEVERESLSEILEQAGVDAEVPPQIDAPAVAPVGVAGAAAEIVSEPLERGAAPTGEALEAATAPEPGADGGNAAPELAPPAVPEAPSATLARLYLDQGHLVEAEAEFRRVLLSRPDDEAAVAGLRELVSRRATDETVSGWTEAAVGAPAPPRPHRAVGLTQRKVETLRGYLERLRRSRARANVS